MNRKKLPFLLFFLTLALHGYGQINLFKDPANFATDVKALMASSNNEAAINAGNGIVSVHSSASEAVKTKLFEISKELFYKKKFKGPQYVDIYVATSAAISQKNISQTDLDSMLYVTQKVIEKYETKQMITYFTTVRSFFEKDALFFSQFNSLYVKNGSYKFRFVEAAPVPDPYEEPVEEEKVEEENAFEDWDTEGWEEQNYSTFEEEPVVEEPVQEQVLDVGYLPPPQPPIEGAVITFENIDLRFETPYDKTELKGTSGSLLLKNNVFVGKGGKFDWSVAGAGPDEIYAELKEYNFPIITAKLYSEGASLTYPSITDKPVEGIFEFKSIRHNGAADASYPRFKSFGSNVEVKGLGENIEYVGGLSLSGKKIYSSSIDEETSLIKIKKDDKVIIKARSGKFTLGDSLISCNLGRLVVFVNDGKDSIIHPGVTLKFNKSIPQLRAVKNGSFKYAPFIDTYHNLDISVDGILWDLNKPEIDFTIFNGKNQIQAVFESEQYYQADKYSAIQGIYRFHPLQMLMGYARTHPRDSGVFQVQDIATETKIDIASAKGAMDQLMKLGFIDYNSKTGIVRLRPKATHYVMARRDIADYDNIILYSLTPAGPNATLHLDNNDLVVRGVEKVFLSDSLRVFILPDSNTVRFQQNRDFQFNGKINTENFQFVGTDFNFKYDSFLVRLKNIDEIKVAVTEKSGKDKNQQGKSRVLGNELKYSSGTLYINKPNNKSSRKKFPEYPAFDAATGATVYFAKKHINGGAYDTTIKFKVPPFKVDSLSSDDPHAIGFDGEFESGGIFPTFKEKLVVMPDFSLGFVHNVPKDGYQLYQNKGKFFNKITLDNQGVRGDGEIHYLTTTAYSKDFIFYKDSVITIGTKVDTKTGTHPETKSPDVTFPDMQIGEYAMRWKPYQDSMILTNVKEPFHLYKETAKLEGKSIITGEGMRGQGALFTRGSESQSDNFHFEQTKFSGRNSKFQILTENPDKPALLCNDVKLDFDLEKRFAYFSPEVEGFASNNFPYLQYKSSLDKGVWDLDHKIITMKMEEGGDINKSVFYSTHPNQDSLVFNAMEGIYDMEKQNLNINGVPFIKVADGKIFPDSNKVRIHENAVMETLKNAKIIIDTIHEYHHLYDGTIDVKGRKRFDGEATYQYVNLGADTLSIKFQDFRLQESLKKKGRASTVATGVVREEDSLFIDKAVIYKGKVTMYADNKILFFDGYVQLVLNGALHYSQWLKYINNGDRAAVVIDVTDPKTDNGQPLYSGLHFCAQDSIKFYATFTSQKKTPSDLDIFTAKGLLVHDPVTGLFTVMPQEKMEKKSLVGNVFNYNDSLSTIDYSGKFNFTTDDPSFTVATAGNGAADLNAGKYDFSTFQTFTSKGAAAAFTPIGQNMKLVASVMPSDTVAPTDADFENHRRRDSLMPYRLAEFIGDKGVQDYKSKAALGYVPLPTVSGDFAKAIVLSNVDYKWSHEMNAWYSVGKIKVANIMKEDINKEMKGYVEIRKTVKGDLVNIYLEPSSSNWYFFSYENNRLLIAVGNDELNTILSKKNKGEMPTREKFFHVIGTAVDKTQFVHFFEEHYLGIVKETAFEQHEQETIDVPDAELEKQKEEEQNNNDEEKKSPYPYEEKLEYERKEGKTIEEPELNREKKEHTIEEKKQLQQDQQKMKNLFSN